MSRKKKNKIKNAALIAFTLESMKFANEAIKIINQKSEPIKIEIHKNTNNTPVSGSDSEKVKTEKPKEK